MRGYVRSLGQGMILAAFTIGSVAAVGVWQHHRTPAPWTAEQRDQARALRIDAYHAALEFKYAEVAQWEDMERLEEGANTSQLRNAVAFLRHTRLDPKSEPEYETQVVGLERSHLPGEPGKLASQLFQDLARQKNALNALGKANDAMGKLVDQVRASNRCPKCGIDEHFHWVPTSNAKP